MANVSQSEFEDLTPWKLQIAQPHLDKHNLIGVGVFAHVYRIDKESVRKVPALDSGDLELAIKSIQREGETYLHLGSHPRVIKCITTGDFFVDLEYAPHGHIENYLRGHHDTTDEIRMRLAQGVIEAVVFIHSKKIIHSDLAARQFLLDSELHVKISDLGFSSFSDGDVLGFENSSYHLPRDLNSKTPSTIQSDLFALGSTLYEIMTGRRPYEAISDDAITELYVKGCFPEVMSILCGDVIMSC
ncbi:kinase-like domain-containing protein [Leptodontidium sp. 2 PMI_412]|nr:kinase-like domain-containing protein [Leptodontidium sp. 2 PMI_412]